MNVVRLRTEIPVFLACTLSVALYVAIGFSTSRDWILDLLTGLVAAVAGLAACSELARAISNRRVSLLWLLVTCTLALVCVTQFREALVDRLGASLQGIDFNDCLILAVGPLLLWVTSRLDPIFARARRMAYLGFAVQLIATFEDICIGARVIHGKWSPLTDFANFLSVSLYLLAVFWIVFDAGRALGLFAAETRACPLVSRAPANSRPGSIRDRLYPPPFILGLHLPPPETPAGRVHRLCNQAMWPAGDIVASARNLMLIAVWPVVAAARAFKQVREQGGALRELSDKSRWRQFVEQVQLAICYRIPPKYYYVYEFYRPERQRLAAHYLMRYETKEIAYRLIYPVATVANESTPLKDKAAFARHCQDYGLKHAPTLFVFADGEPANADLLGIDLFVKPVRGKGSSGAEKWTALGRGIYRDNRGWELDERELLAHLRDLSRFVEPYIVQPAFRNHPFMADLAPGALSTLRMLTFRSENGDYELTNAVIRMPVSRSAAVDNFHAGGIASSVDLKSGKLGPATNLGMKGETIWYDHHPVTGAQIAGRQLPMWREAVDLVLRAHEAFADYALVGWEVALLHDGPMLIDGNRGPDVDILQRTGRGPIGLGRFGELLAYNLENRPIASRLGWSDSTGSDIAVDSA